MKIEELRIGNWLKAIGKESFYQVKGINEITIDVATDRPNNYKRYLLDGFEGIPINEEWLVKFGFVKNLKHGIENYISCDFTYYPSNKQVKIFDRFGGSIYVENIEFIHQLQNLYFALTQKEL